MQRICVYCGSSPGLRSEYRQAAEQLGMAIAARQIGLVYGGGSIGLMGVIADAVLSHGGEVIGVLPCDLFRQEVAHPGLTQLHEVNSLHARKALMADLADGFIAMPGGFGTLDELFEIVTWAQLGIHTKPIGLLNVLGYFDPLLQMITTFAREGFIRPDHVRLLMEESDPDLLLTEIVTLAPPRTTS